MLSLTGTEAISLVASVFGLAILMAGAIAVVFSQAKKNGRDYVRQENADLTVRLETVEKERDELKERVAALEGALAVVSGMSAVTELRAAVTAYHEELTKRLDRLWDRRMCDEPVVHDRRGR